MDVFRYDPAHRAIICTECSCAVSLVNIRKHLERPKHKSAELRPDEIGKGLQERYRERPVVNPEDLWIPVSAVGPVDGLDILPECFRCGASGCQAIYRSERRIRQHYQEKHGPARQRVGKPRKYAPDEKLAAARPWRAVSAQQFTRKGRGSQLFEVTQAAAGRGSISAEQDTPADRQAKPSEPAWVAHKAKAKEMARTAMEKIRKVEVEKVQGFVNRATMAWLDQVKWAEYLQGYNRKAMAKLVEKPDAAEEPVLDEICRRFGSIIPITQETMRRRVLNAVKFEINRKYTAAAVRKPFQPRMEADTVRRYIGVFQQVICFIFRAARYWKEKEEDGEDDDEGEDDNSDDEVDEDEFGLREPPKFRIGPAQQQAMDTLINSIVGRNTRDESRNGASEDDEDEDGEEEQRKEKETGRLQRVNRLLLRWLVELFDQEIDDRAGNEYQNPVIAALAIMGIREDGGWVDPLNYTPKLSAIIKLARLLVVQQAWEVSCDGDSELDCFHATRNMVRGFMTADEPMAMKFIFDMRTFGLHIRLNTPAGGTIGGEGDRIVYQDIEFTRSQFQSMVHGCVNRAWATLASELFAFEDDDEHRRALPAIPWDRLHDNPAETRVGWSFLQDRRNALPVDGDEWLLDRVWDVERLRHEFVRRDGGCGTLSPYKEERVRRWMRSVGRFKELLLVLMHIAGGQPARGSEITSIRHRNTPNGGRRNVFIEDGLVSFVTAYHKGYNASGTEKTVSRYLPREVGELVVYYIWLVLPAQERWEAVVYGTEEFDAFMWSETGDVEGGKWTGDRMRRAMVRETELGMGASISMSAYRQIAIAMSRRFIGREHRFQLDTVDELEDEEDEDGCWWRAEDDAADLQAAHGTRIAGLVYARELTENPFTYESMRRRFRAVSRRWHRFLRFSSALRSPSAEDEAVAKVQGAAVPSSPLGKRKRQASEYWEERDRSVRLGRLKEMRAVNIYAILAQLMGPAAQFRGVQEQTIQAIMGGEPRVLAVMGTGSGKSLTFMLPAAWRYAGTTVVVVPMTALRQDMKRRCDEWGITCEAWDSSRPPEAVTVVLVTPESAVTKAFFTFMNRLRGTHQLERIVIDECHTVLDATLDFRPKMLDMTALMALGCQVVLLTATLPPQEEAEFLQRLGLRESSMRKFRARTSRRNIKYGVEDYDGSDEAALEIIRQRAATLEQGGGKMFVYATTKARVDALAEALGCAAFHADRPKKRREKILQQLTGKEHQIVVATKGLGLGVDIPDVRIVIHVDIPSSLRDYGQESGRAGRDGGKSEALILRVATRKGTGSAAMARKAVDSVRGKAEMTAFVENPCCRRVTMDRYMDGDEEKRWCGDEDEGEQLCDVCERAVAQTRGGDDGEGEEAGEGEQAEEARRRRQQEEEETAEAGERQRLEAQRQRRLLRAKVSQEAEEGVRLVELLEEWNRKCAMCYIRGRETSGCTHVTKSCNQWGEAGEEVKKRLAQCRDTFRVHDYAGCRRCGLPQVICQRFEATEQGRTMIPGRKCQFEYVLLDVVAAGMLMEAGSDVAAAVKQQMEDANLDGTSDEEEKEWFVKKRVWGVFKETNKLTEVFFRFADYFSRR